MSTRRKMLAADEDIANKIVKMAQLRGSTVYQTVNDILAQAIKADEMGMLLSDIVNDRGMLERARNIGFIFTIEALLYDVVELAYGHAKKQVSDLWLETGRWYGEYFSKRNNEGLEEFQGAMKLLTFGSSEFKIKVEKGDNVAVTCVGERFTIGFTEVFGSFMVGVFEVFGYELKKKESSRGIIRLYFEKAR